jgi:integrase
MAYVWKRDNSPYWVAVFKNENNVWTKKSTKQTNRTKANALAIEWERVGALARDRVITESVCREVIGGILKRTTGEELRSRSVRVFCDEWLRGKESRRQEGTAARYATTKTRFLKFLGNKADLPITAVTALDCQKFHDELAESGLAPATLRVEIKTISTIFNQARRLGLIDSNPATAVELEEKFKQVKRKTFTEAQVQMLIDASAEWKTAILLGYYAGLRMGDAVTIDWGAIDFDNHTITIDVQKTGDTIVVPMHLAIEEHLLSIAGDKTGEICPELASQKISGRSGLSRKFLLLMKEAGISSDAVQTGGKRTLARLSFHALRTTFNSALHNKGVDQELRRKLTGHSSNAVNDRYTQTEMATMRDAVSKLPTLKI